LRLWIDFVEGNINNLKYIHVLDDNLWPADAVVARHFPQKNSIFQDNNVLIHRAQKVMMEYRAIFIINAKTKKLRVTTCLENLEMSGNLTAFSEMSGILLKVREMSWENLVGKVA